MAGAIGSVHPIAGISSSLSRSGYMPDNADLTFPSLYHLSLFMATHIDQSKEAIQFIIRLALLIKIYCNI